MKNIKKIISLLLASILCLSVLSVPNYAASREANVSKVINDNSSYTAQTDQGDQGLIFSKETYWHYRETTSKLTDTSWSTSGYTMSSSWTEGQAPIGYASSSKPMYGLLNTRLEKKPADRFYARKSFYLDDASEISGFYANVSFDDAFIVYLNGKWVGAENLLQENGNQYGHHFVGDYPEDTLIWIDGKFLQDGENVIGVEVINTTSDSSDLYIDMDLWVGETLVSKESILEFYETTKIFETAEWATNGYNEVVWDSGQAPIGFCNPGVLMDSLINKRLENTKGHMEGIAYFRKTFYIEDLSKVETLLANIGFDDGVRVYINGKFIGQENIPDIAGSKPVGVQYVTWNMQINPAFLLEGENTIGIELHNNNIYENRESSDMFIDIGLGIVPVQEYDGTTKLIRSGDVWNYIEDQTVPDADWQVAEEVSGSAWLEGHSGFGYSARSPKQADFDNARTKISYGEDVMPLKVYFHKIIEIEDLSKAEALYAKVSYDDSVEIFINGELSKTYNHYNEHVRGTINDDVEIEEDWLVTDALKEGSNVITAVLYNTNDTSTDIYFDLEITAYDEKYERAEYEVIDLVMTPGKDAAEMLFAWYTPRNSAEISIVQIAEKKDMVGDEFPESSEGTFTGKVFNASAGYSANHVDINGIEPETEYVYRVGDGEKWSEVYDYTSRSTAEYKALFFGDVQIGSSTTDVGEKLNSEQAGEAWKKTIAMAVDQADGEAAFIITAGDNVQDADNESQYKLFFAPDEIRNYPMASVIGNHDGNNIHHSLHFNKPNTGANGLGKSSKYVVNYTTNAGSNNYFSYGNTLYIYLNTNTDNVAHHKATIDEAIASHPDAKWRIVAMHHDVYGAGRYHSGGDSIKYLREKLFPLYDEAEIDVVLTGHDHSYARSYQMYNNEPMLDQKTPDNGMENTVIDPTGTLYLTANSASGSQFYTIATEIGAHVANAAQYGVPTYMVLEITDESFTMKNYRTDTNEMDDHYTIIKTTELSREKEELEKIIKEAKELDSSKYTEESWKLLEAMIEKAENELENENATVGSVKHAANMLSLAMKMLDSVKDNRAILKIFIEAALEAIDSGDVDAARSDVQSDFYDALEGAELVYDDPNADMDEIIAAAKVLLNELHRLGFIVGNTKYLHDLYDFCDSLNMDNYADGAEKNRFLDALEAAADVLAEEEPLDGDVQAAYEELLDASGKLKTASRTMADLLELIAVAEECVNNKDKYVEKGMDELEDALGEAKSIADNQEASAVEISGAINKLATALANIRYKADKSMLEGLVMKAAAVNYSMYTAESVKVLQDVLVQAQAILEDESLSQDDQETVDNIAEKLQIVLSELNDQNGNGSDNEESDETDQTEEQSKETKETKVKETEVQDGKTSDKDGKNNVKTGDTSSILLLSLAMVSTGLLLAALKKRGFYR